MEWLSYYFLYFKIFFLKIISYYKLLKLKLDKSPKKYFSKVYHEPSDRRLIVDKIKDWQYRQEKDSPLKNIIQYATTPNVEEVIKSVQDFVLFNIKYQKDSKIYGQKEFWATTKEIREKYKGDCEDQAFIIMEELISHNIPSDRVGAIYINEEKSKNDHVIAILEIENGDFYLLDNGTYFAIPVKASEFFKNRNDIKILVAFNFDEIWVYN